MTKVRRYPARRARVRVQGVIIGQFQLEDSILAYRPCETLKECISDFPVRQLYINLALWVFEARFTVYLQYGE
jgi:hypothetical protein